MNKQVIKVKTGGNPSCGQDAKLYKNSIGENQFTTKTQWNYPIIGKFNTAKDSDGYAEIELQKDVYLVYQDGKRYKFTVGTTVEIEEDT